MTSPFVIAGEASSGRSILAVHEARRTAAGQVGRITAALQTNPLDAWSGARHVYRPVMWLVRVALKRPYTLVVMSMLIVILGVTTILRMPTDIFPDIDIPVISVIWNYAGLPPEEMEKRIITNYERALTTTVNDIDHIESQSLSGVAVVKIFFQPGARIEAATAQVTAISQTVVRQMPPGTTPPFIIRYSASNVPIIQAALESSAHSEQQLFDFGTNFIRPDIVMVPGAMMPWPYGGKQRQ